MLFVATAPPLTPSADPSAAPTPTPTPGPTGIPSVNVDETVKVVTKTTSDLVTIGWQAGVGAIIGIAIAFVAVAILSFMGKRRLLYREIVDFGRRPAYAVGTMAGAFLGTQIALTGLRQTKDDSTTMAIIERGVTIALIFAVTWLVVAFAKAIESTVVKGVQASENQGRANRVTTQSQIIRRVAEAIIIIAGLVSAIMTFPTVQFAMGSLLASAGLASVIAGMAARSMLGNVFAGLQLATTDAIRVDDIVVVDDEQGTIEEITLTYVVMRTWDERRLILPSTHFTENPFANWTRGEARAPVPSPSTWTGAFPSPRCVRSWPGSWAPPPSGTEGRPPSTSPTPSAITSPCAWSSPGPPPAPSATSSPTCARSWSPGCSGRPPTPCRAHGWRSSR